MLQHYTSWSWAPFEAVKRVTAVFGGGLLQKADDKGDEQRRPIVDQEAAQSPEEAAAAGGEQQEHSSAWKHTSNERCAAVEAPLEAQRLLWRPQWTEL